MSNQIATCNTHIYIKIKTFIKKLEVLFRVIIRCAFFMFYSSFDSVRGTRAGMNDTPLKNSDLSMLQLDICPVMLENTHKFDGWDFSFTVWELNQQCN